MYFFFLNGEFHLDYYIGLKLIILNRINLKFSD